MRPVSYPVLAVWILLACRPGRGRPLLPNVFVLCFFSGRRKAPAHFLQAERLCRPGTTRSRERFVAFDCRNTGFALISPERISNMEMLIVVGLGLLTYAVIEQQHAAMRRIMKVCIKGDEQRDR